VAQAPGSAVDGGAVRRFENVMRVGTAGVEVPVPAPKTCRSFGGQENSLFGGTSAHGAEGVHFSARVSTRGKVGSSRSLDPSHGCLDLGFPTHS
jgi:malonate-semialdehyde dehydrogenase (acetylating)/methylmalonate-semialdehyde dehydrogenase